MKTFLKALTIAFVTVLFVACTSTPKLPEYLIGQWDGQAMGQAVTLEYGPSTITVVGMGFEIPYKLEGNQLTMDVMGQSRTSTVEIINDNEMKMMDQENGQAVIWKRKM